MIKTGFKIGILVLFAALAAAQPVSAQTNQSASPSSHTDQSPQLPNIQPIPFAEFDKMDMATANQAAQKYLNERFPPGTLIKDFIAALVASGAQCVEPRDPVTKDTHFLNVADCSIQAHRKNSSEVQWGASAYASPENLGILLNTAIQIQTEGFRKIL